jgi:hypothetical protein
VAAAGTVVVAIGGHTGSEWAHAADRSIALAAIARVVFVVVPDLDRFDVDAIVLHDQPVAPAALAGTAAYALAWVVALIAAAAYSVRRQDPE